MKTKTSKNKNSTIYLISITAAYVLILLSLAAFPPLLQLPLWLMGAVCLPPLALAYASQVGAKRFYALTALFLAAAAAVGQSVGILLFVLLFGAAAILYPFIRRSPDLFPVLLCGGSLFLLCVAVCAALMIQAHYGVFDFRSVYAALEQNIIAAAQKMAQVYISMLGDSVKDTMQQFVTLISDNVDAYITQMITLVCTVLSGLYFWTLKAAQFLVRKTNGIAVLPVRLFSVPRSVTFAFVILYMAGIFTVGTDYQYAFELANTLMGYIFVLCGIGLIDLFLSAKLNSAAGRMVIKAVLLAGAFVSENFLTGLLYLFLMVLGVFVSTTRKLMIFRSPGQKNGENDHE